MDAAVWQDLSQAALFLDQTEARLEIDRDQVEMFYLPVANYLLGRLAPSGRLLVGVAGPPGSGKTVFAMLLAAVVNALNEEELAIVVGLDGWHYPNAYLESQAIETDTGVIGLKNLKGIPETFDVAAALGCFASIRLGETASIPVYSRELHDPLPNARLVHPHHRMVIAEGNFLLLDEGEWAAFKYLFDVSIFIKAEPRTLRAALAMRHRRGGKTPAQITHHLETVDLPNAERVLANSSPAQIVILKKDAWSIERIEGLDRFFIAAWLPDGDR
jgi:hypothetical protein